MTRSDAFCVSRELFYINWGIHWTIIFDKYFVGIGTLNSDSDSVDSGEILQNFIGRCCCDVVVISSYFRTLSEIVWEINRECYHPLGRAWHHQSRYMVTIIQSESDDNNSVVRFVQAMPHFIAIATFVCVCVCAVKMIKCIIKSGHSIMKSFQFNSTFQLNAYYSLYCSLPNLKKSISRSFDMESKQKFVFLLLAMFGWQIVSIHGHGMLMDPISRGSRWRRDPTAPHDYDDNALYCGGFQVNSTICLLAPSDLMCAEAFPPTSIRSIFRSVQFSSWWKWQTSGFLFHELLIQDLLVICQR